MGTKLLRSETLRSSRADFSYEKIVMENGLTVLVAPMPGYRAMQAAFAANFGSVDRRFLWQGREVVLRAQAVECAGHVRRGIHQGAVKIEEKGARLHAVHTKGR